MQLIHECDKYLVEYYPVEGGLLSIEVLETGESFMVGIRSTLTGRCIVRGQWCSSVKSHGIKRAVDTFRELQIKES